jgi:hypothetical protein
MSQNCAFAKLHQGTEQTIVDICFSIALKQKPIHFAQKLNLKKHCIARANINWTIHPNISSAKWWVGAAERGWLLPASPGLELPSPAGRLVQ